MQKAKMKEFTALMRANLIEGRDQGVTSVEGEVIS
jgi:hypothetical protein